MDFYAIQARVRPQAAAENLADSGQDLAAMNNRRDLLITQSLPERTELARLGTSFAVTQSGTTTSTNAALPTTTAGYTVYNTAQAGGVSVIIDMVTFIVLTAAAGASGITTVACVNKGAQTALSSPDSNTIATLNGRASSGVSVVATKSGVTITNDGWFALASAPAVGTTSKSSGIIAYMEGAIIVPPQGQVSFHAIGDGTAAGKFSLTWHEQTIKNVA